MKNSQKLRVAVIGCGVIGPFHADCFKRNKEAELVCVCDLSAKKARETAAKFNAPWWTTDANEVFLSPSVDAVSICTDHASHAALAIAALKAGKHVLCEKCLAVSKPDLAKMLKAASARPDLVNAAVFQHRFEALPREIKSIIDEGLIGSLSSASGSLNCRRPNGYYSSSSWRGTLKGEGGSVMINQAIHFFDLLLWITGGGVDICGFKANRNHPKIETEDTAAASIKLANGALATFSASNATSKSWRYNLSLFGTEGAIAVTDDKTTLISFADKKLQTSVEKRLAKAEKAGSIARGKPYYGCGHQAQIDDFVNAALHGMRPFVSFEDAAKTAELLFKFYKSAK